MKNPELLFETSHIGRQGWSTGKLNIPSPPIEDILPAELLRDAKAELPDVTELDVVRHFTHISKLNACIDTHFYPLGSCTMKYNPKVNEQIARMPGFVNLHPYAPVSDCQGTLEILFGLQQMLSEICGMAAFTLHPAAGAQGEFAGILVAKAYHESNGDKRTRIVIPDTAHGTNPASAHLGGYDVVTIKSNQRGRTDLDVLRESIDDQVALFMLTNPNTLGLFEEDILEIAKIVHSRGALLYLDGANLNALAGLVRPGELGFDIVHVNTHKTLSTPHGGGGPGAGPLGVVANLADFLPGWVIKEENNIFQPVRPPKSIGLLRGYLGSISILIRAYAYLRAVGAEGLRESTRGAIINANYLRERLKDTYEPYVDEVCMHECVLSAKLQKGKGVRALDIGKRLLDYGMHPPTTYFPLIVDEALMVEPTESETKNTLDKFAEAMLEIDAEIQRDPDFVKGAPYTTPVARLDDVRAARDPILRWTPKMQVSNHTETKAG